MFVAEITFRFPLPFPLPWNLVVRDNTSTLIILKDAGEEDEITRVKRDRDSCGTNAKVISPFL